MSVLRPTEPAQRHPRVFMSISISKSSCLIYKAGYSDDRAFWTLDNLPPLQMIVIVQISRDMRVLAAASSVQFRSSAAESCMMALTYFFILTWTLRCDF
ncbi:hypothetical protein M3J09_000106 [Ascochyta lentis]